MSLGLHAGALARPADLPVRETLRFLERALPPAPARLLEVGSGDGAIARSLAAAGYDVTGLDEAIDPAEASKPAAATLAGAAPRWKQADFLFYQEEDPYDAILFTRSLHHMSSASAALSRAYDLLKPGGLLVGEEFAHDRVNIQTARWLYDLESVLAAAGLLSGGSDAGAPEGNPLGRWRREHATDPPLQTGHALLAAARERFELTAVEEAPYLYRYLCERLEPTERGARVLERILEIESRLIRERDIAAAGLRLIGRKGE